MSTVDFAALTDADELSFEDIVAIEQAGSEKGIYQRDLLDFVHSGKRGIPYKFSGKNAQSVKMGFGSAVDALQKREDVSTEDKEAVKAVEVRVRKVKGKDASGNDVEQEFVFLFNQKVIAAQKGNVTAPDGQSEPAAEPATVE